MGDILSSISLLLTIITVLYGQWYSDINKACKIKGEDFKTDNGLCYEEVGNVLFKKVLPLFIASLLINAVILPDVLKILIDVFKILINHKKNIIQYYDVVRASYLLVWLFALGILIYVSVSLIKLCLKRYELKPQNYMK